MQAFITLVFWVLLGSITAYYAKERGRSQWGWFSIGLLLGIFGLILLFVLPKKKAERQEIRVVAAAEPTLAAQAPPRSSKFWYYLDPQNKQFGPMSFDALQSASQEGKITPTTYVWSEDLENWKRFGELT